MTDQEINQLIAEKVMGWTLSDGAWHDADGQFHYFDFEGWQRCWNPAIYISQAFEAVEVLRLRDPENNHWDLVSPFSVPEHSAHKKNHLFCAGVRWGDVQVRAYAHTPALAICTALVKAVSDD